MKNARHEMILELVEKYDIETQEELLDLLFKAGFNVTQAVHGGTLQTDPEGRVCLRGGRSQHHCRKDGLRHGDGGRRRDRQSRLAGSSRLYRGR